jgi:hypothetical protein
MDLEGSSAVTGDVIGLVVARPLPTVVLALGIAGVCVVLWANAMHLRSFRADVPRSIRESRTHRGSLPLDVDLGDYYTVAGRRWRALAYGASPSILLVILGGLGLRDGPGPEYARTSLALALPIAGIIVALGVRVRRAMQHESRLLAQETSPGRFRPVVEPVAIAEFGPDHRRLCACCGYPTVAPDDESRSCDLCDWSAEGDAEAPALHVAQQHFQAHRTIYGAVAPAWRGRPLSDDERAARERAVQRFELARASPEGFSDPALWLA